MAKDIFDGVTTSLLGLPDARHWQSRCRRVHRIRERTASGFSRVVKPQPLSISINFSKGSADVRKSLLLTILSLIAIHAHSHDGFVLKAGGGDSVGNGIVIKVSPQNASTQAILVEQTFEMGGRTGLHIHDQGDELFYVVSGRGAATLGDRTENLEAGDVIFVPGGTLHGIGNLDNTHPLVVVFFMDSPELVDQFRAFHQRRVSDPDRPISAEERIAIQRRFGGSRPMNSR